MVRTCLLFILMIFSIANPVQAMRQLKDVYKSQQDATITVRNAERLATEYLVLDATWEYSKSNLIDPGENFLDESRKTVLVTLPHFFEPDVHYASYHCRVQGLLPNTCYGMNIYGRFLTSCRIWCNKQFVGMSGLLSKDKASSNPGLFSSIIELPSDENGIIDITIQVADFELEKSGIVEVPVITEKNNLQRKYVRIFFFDSFIMAFLFMLIIYNLIFIMMNRKPLVYFSLVVNCVFLMLSVAATGISIFNLIFVKTPFWIERRLAVVLLACDVSAYIFYMGVSHRISGKKVGLMYVVSLAAVITSFFVPINVFEKYKIIFILIPLLLLTFVFIMSLKFLLKKNAKSNSSIDTILYNFDMFISLGILVAYYYDFLFAPKIITPVHSFVVFKIAIMFFGFMQCAVPAFRRYFTNYRIQKSSERFEQNNNVLAKFISPQILRFLNADGVTKIIPNTCYSMDAMIVYTEIRYFKQLAESVDSKELFEIVGVYYNEISPIIQSFGGYIVRYMSHGCLAVFAERNDTVIKCALRMQEKMENLRRVLRKNHNVDISIGIAIHTGRAACGIIGSEKRLSSIIFSPEVKTAINIGIQTSKTNRKILISEDAMAYCRTYVDCMYEGHFILSAGKRILVYNAIPFKNFDADYGEVLELVEEVEDEA